MKSALERYYDGMGNVVIRDGNGNPSIFVRHVKVSSDYFDSSLPNHTHPAFIVNGTEDPALLIGKYLGCQPKTNGVIYSLPNASPQVADMSMLAALPKIRAAGENVSGMTIADLGLLALLAQKNPYLWQATDGCITNGASRNAGGDYWIGEGNVTVGALNVHHGYLYECLIAHTRSNDIVPDKSPLYWKKLRKVGGTHAFCGADFGSTNSYAYASEATLTGSGPLDWHFMADPELEADIIGDMDCMIYGLAIRGSEINIMADNNAADPNADLSANSSAWRAILPHQNDTGHDLVAPGTEGTLHLASVDGKATVVARTPQASEIASRLPAQNGLIVDSLTMSYTPYILQELGLVSLPGKSTPVMMNITLSADTNSMNGIRLRKHESVTKNAFCLWNNTFTGIQQGRYTTYRLRARDLTGS